MWVLVCALLLLQESALAHLLAIAVLAAGPVIAWRLAKSCYVEVPRHRALIVENRNTHRIEVLLTGYHGSLPGLYRDRSWT
jgi:hypothetical protein